MTATKRRPRHSIPPVAEGRTPQRRWHATAAAALAAAIVIAAAIYVERPAPLVDLNALLLEQGFVPNPGFTAVYRPGDVIQLVERGERGEALKLGRPVLFLRRETCFPGLVPGEAPFGLPAVSGQRALALDGTMLGRWLPQLRLGGRELLSYSCVVENARLATIAKAELSEQFAPPCIERYSRALAGGDAPTWFATVIEAVVADALTLSVDWRAGTTAAARAAFRQRATGALPAQGTVSTELDSSAKTVLKVAGPLVLAYRYRLMEPVRAEAHQ